MDNIASGLQSDYDNMTKEVGMKVLIYPRRREISYEGQDSETDDRYEPIEEIAVLQELNSTHEMVSSGMFNIGDVEIIFLSNTVIEPEGFVYANESWYKVITLNKYRGFQENKVLYVKGFGKKVVDR